MNVTEIKKFTTQDSKAVRDALKKAGIKKKVRLFSGDWYILIGGQLTGWMTEDERIEILEAIKSLGFTPQNGLMTMTLVDTIQLSKPA